MRHACARLCQHAQLFVVEVNAVGEPDVVACPAEVLHVFKRAHALAREHKGFLVFRFTKVRVQAHAVLPCKQRALAQKIGGDGEGGAGRERHAVHRAEGLVVVALDDARGVF